jgi:hypothetical protein
VIEDGAVLHSKVATPQVKAGEAAAPETAAVETAAVEPPVSKETRAKAAGA